MNEATKVVTGPETGRPAATMSAIVQHGYGSTEVLKFQTVDKPSIGETEVLIRVHAASVNHADWVMTTGVPLIGRLAFGIRAPKEVIRGRDVAGRIEAVGARVTRFVPGDEVYAEVDTGSFAEYARAPEDLVAAKPSNLSFEQAATVPTSANTALQGLRDRGGLKAGQRVLVNGASGGVGTFALQIAKAMGAEVTAVCSARNVAQARSLGADYVIDYAREDFTATGSHFDLIFDLVGNHSLAHIRRVLTRRGTLVLSSGTGSRIFGPLGRLVTALLLSTVVSQSLRPLAAVRNADSLDHLRELIESGAIAPAIEKSYPLREVPAAIHHLATERAQAKIAILVRAD